VLGLWGVIKSGADDYRDDRSTLASILHTAPLEMQAGLAVKSMAHEAREAIHKVRVDVDRVKEADTKLLRQEFDDITFKPSESVENFLLCLNTVASQLRVLGNEITDKEVIKRLLHAVPKNLEQVTISMETLLDLYSLSIEEVVGHLRAVEQRKKLPVSKETGVGCSSQKRSGWLA
jgi:hypothetical protein